VLERFLPGLGHVQNIHPLFVHFPVALLLTASLFYLIAWIGGHEAIKWTAFWVLILGAISAAAALATGLYAGPGVMISESVREQLLRHHMRIMIAMSVLTGILAIWAIAARPMPLRGRIIFMLGLLVVVVLISIGADLGSEMVYGYNAGGDACPQPIELNH
jgi:uncharacterized membrane protein